ncbi:MAG: M23 family metallopeptidase, partial [Myxococcales bacterium]|nr:M23 family metallopeptidase [Myxococcales bacterium]
SHNGTDFSIPVGSTVTAAAPGRVVRLASEFNRGGLKLFIDHGEGLMTCTAHLARPLVAVGDTVERGQPVALSGYSGIDALVTFPWGTPHIHFNVWLDAEPVDPFPHGDATSMWRAGDLPRPAAREPGSAEPSGWDADRVADGIDACLTRSSRERIAAIEPLEQRGAALVAEMNYYPTRFPRRISPYASTKGRAPHLDLPFSADEFDGIVFVDDL